MREAVDGLAEVGRARPRPTVRLVDEAHFGAWIREDVLGRATPGLAVAAFDEGGIRYAEGFGERVAGAGSFVDAKTPFRWFSITKVVTAMAVLRLVEAGALTLDDRVTDRLSWFRRVDPESRVRVEDLLRHRSGLGNPPPFGWGRPVEAPGWDVAEEVRRATLRQPPITAQRHGRPAYTNLGYLVLGELIRAVADQPLEVLAGRDILAPLGLEDTVFGPGDEARSALPHELVLHPRPWVFAAFAGAPRRFIDGRAGRFVRVHPFQLMGAAFGDLSGSVTDLARLGVAHLANGAGIVTPAHARRMREPVAGYGLGWHLDGDAVGHTGSGIGYRSELRLYPVEGFGVAVLCNVGHLDTAPVAEALAGLARRAS